MTETDIQNESAIFQSTDTRYRPLRFVIAALAIIFVTYQVIGGLLTLLLIGGTVTIDNVTAARLATMVSQLVFLLVPVLWLAKRQHGRITEIFPMRLPSVMEAVLAIVGMIALMQLGEFYLYFQSKIPVPESIAPFLSEMKRMIEVTFRTLVVAHSVPEMLFVVTVAAMTPAICEEAMFRGLIQKNLTLSSGTVKGFILTGTIFGLYHMNPFWIVPLVALGIYFSFLRYRSQSLVLPVVAHLLNNASAVVGVYVYGETDDTTPTMFMGQAAEPSTAAVLGTAAFFALIFFLVMIQYIRITDRKRNSERRSMLQEELTSVPDGFVPLRVAEDLFAADLIGTNLSANGVEVRWVSDDGSPATLLCVRIGEEQRAEEQLTSLDLIDFTRPYVQ